MATNACRDVVVAFLGTGHMPPELTFWALYPQNGSQQDLSTKYPCLVGAADPNQTINATLKGIGNHPIPLT